MDVLSLAAFIAKTRQDKGLTLEDVAKRAVLSGKPLSVGYIHKLEQGTTQEPSLGKLEALAAGLGVGMGHLLVAAKARDFDTLAPSEATPPKASQLLPVRALKVVGPASCGAEIWTPAGEGDEMHTVSTDTEGDVAVRIEGDSMSGRGIWHGDKAVIVRADPGSLRDGDGACLDVAGTYVIKLFRSRGGEQWLEEHRQGQEPRRVEFPEATIIGRVVEVSSSWRRR